MESDVIKLVNDFVEAVENGDQPTIDLITSESFEFKEKYFGRKHKEVLRKPSVEFFKDSVHKLWIEPKPYFYLKEKEAKVVYEISTDWRLSNTKFQSGFIRNSFYFTKDDKWKLKAIKKEFLRLSKYDIKESFNGLIVWFSV